VTTTASAVHVAHDPVVGVATVTLDAPPLNALGSGGLGALADVLEGLSGRADVLAVVLWGGPRAFGAGHDLDELIAVVEGGLPAETVVDAMRRATAALAGLGVPTVAAIVGHALGPGLELALACEVRVAADNAKLGFPEVLMGLMPWGGGTQRLTHLVGGSRARDLVATGRMVDMTEAPRIGLVDSVHPVDHVLAEAQALAAKLVAGPASRALAVDAVDQASRLGLQDGLALERRHALTAFATADARVGVSAFLPDGPGTVRFGGR